jgi:hypothetical protein
MRPTPHAIPTMPAPYMQTYCGPLEKESTGMYKREEKLQGVIESVNDMGVLVKVSEKESVRSVNLKDLFTNVDKGRRVVVTILVEEKT